ncbi:hypothetical protein A4S05_34930 [Nostoc sp. KVJ20]|nr:hypothetical protein A4S05_34930 [Nostoc sp. KVJ20]
MGEYSLKTICNSQWANAPLLYKTLRERERFAIADVRGFRPRPKTGCLSCWGLKPLKLVKIYSQLLQDGEQQVKRSFHI